MHLLLIPLIEHLIDQVKDFDSSIKIEFIGNAYRKFCILLINSENIVVNKSKEHYTLHLIVKISIGYYTIIITFSF